MNVSTLPTTWLLGPNGQPLAKLTGPIRWNSSSVKQMLDDVMDDMGIDQRRSASRQNAARKEGV